MENETKKKVKKKVTNNVKKKKIKLTFTKYSIWFQTAAILLAIAGISLNLCNCIDINIMLDLFGLAVISLAFSLFPQKK